MNKKNKAIACPTELKKARRFFMRRKHAVDSLSKHWLLGVLTSLSLSSALAQPLTPLADFPKQAFTIISPFPPGGGNDSLARLLASELAPIVGQPVVVENKAGAGGNLGTAYAARAKADGYTLLMSQTSIIAVNPVMYQNAGFVPELDFEPISQLTNAPVVFVVREQSPYKTLSQYIADAKARPQAVNFATPGNGTLSHLTTERLAKQANIQVTHVPYRGAGPATTDLLGGQVDMLVTSPSSIESLVSAGKLRALAATNSDLIGVFTATPTLESLGITGMQVADWYGLFVQKATTTDRVEYLLKAVQQAMNTKTAVAKVNQGGAQVVASDRKDFSQKVTKEIAEWSAVVKAAGVKAE
jgi:tripartite-type tricarboxylate transporter receptor subunit TctC